MIIDFHTHIFPPEADAQRGRLCASDTWFGTCYADPKARLIGYEQLIASMDEAGIDCSVVCGFCWSDPGRCSYHNDYLLEAMRAHPGRIVGLAMVNPRTSTPAAELERWLDKGLAGLGEMNADGQGFALTDPGIHDLLQPLVERGAPLLLHCSEPIGHVYAGKGFTRPELVYELARRLPDLNIVAAHWGGGLPFYELMPEVAAATRRVHYDSAATTYLYSHRVFTTVVSLVGSERVLFGTDHPVLRQDRLLTQVRGLGLDESDLANILGLNAERLLGRM